MTDLMKKAEEYADKADTRECGNWVREHSAYLAGAREALGMATDWCVERDGEIPPKIDEALKALNSRQSKGE